MRIATYNINGMNARQPVLLRWLEKSRPDVVCLQELKSPQERFPQEELRSLGYEAIWHGQKSWNGVAILARAGLPIETQRGLPGDPDDAHSRYLEAEIGGLTVACLYLPNGNPAPGPKYDYKLSWFERFIVRGAELIASGKREAFGRLVAQGWTDALRTLHPDETIYTYFDYFRNAFQRNAGLRIDHFLLSPALAPRLRAAAVDLEVRGWERSSDHAPVWMELADR
jgi:exodeoxyribonuclease-3